MPTITTEVPETYQSITRPVVNAVVKDLVELMGLPKETWIEFFGAAETQYQTQSTIDDFSVKNKFPFEGRISVEFEEEHLEESILTVAPKRRNEVCVFVDKALGIEMWPVHTPVQIRISFRYRAPDRTTSERWRDEFRIRASQERMALLHQFDYHYPVPYSFSVILHEIYRLRSNVAGYGDTLRDWIRACFSDRATALSTQAGTSRTLVITEKQVGSVGGFEFVSQPEPGAKSGNTPGPWETGFDYTFVYDKVIGCTLIYPLLVHNQLLGKDFRPSEPLWNPDQYHNRRPSQERMLYDYQTNLYKPKEELRRDPCIPAFDDWFPTNPYPKTAPLLTLLLSIDPNDDVLFNLKDLGEYQLSQACLDFLKTEYPFINQFRNSILHVELYRWGDPITEPSVTVDVDLNVRSTGALDLRDVHHARITVVTDLNYLNPSALNRLAKAGPFCLEYLKAAYPRAPLPDLVKGMWVRLEDLLKIARRPGSFGTYSGFYTTAYYTIISKKD